MTLLSAAFAVLFAAIHLGIGLLKFLDRTPRSRWLSAAGGLAVAYVFLHILPELASYGETFAERLGTGDTAAEELVYGIALAGLAFFYGVERMLLVSGDAGREAGRKVPGAGVFWLHIGAFTIYNVIIGYLLMHRDEEGLWPLVIYGTSMSLHFITNDFGLRESHKERYDRAARWIIAGAVLLGWLLGLTARVPEVGVASLFAFLAGGVVLNVLKEELPEERQSRFLPFLFGGLGCAVLLLLAR